MFLCVHNFPEEIYSLSHSIVFSYFFALTTEEVFLISSCCSLELCIQMGISFLFSFVVSFSSFLSYVYGLLRRSFCLFVYTKHIGRMNLSYGTEVLPLLMDISVFKKLL